MLGLLRGLADGGELGPATQDGCGFDVAGVLAPGHEFVRRRVGDGDGEEAGGEDDDGAAASAGITSTT